ncbi:MAG TPA: thioredoxin-disulfide reductase [Dehalococcoidia bacterium]|nr:thioredoxin-disulfide reductase [Dehalococcoidia bacterium]
MECDVVIIGGGPAGLAAGLYAARARRCAVLLEKSVTGGQIALTAMIENYPGFLEGVNGYDLAEAMLKQAEKYGLKAMYVSAHSVERAEDRFLVKTSEGELRTKTVIAAGGAAYKKLGVAGEERLTGRGVSFCATCDAAFFRDQEVLVVGGGDAAIDESLFLARYAAKIHVVHRRDRLRATPVLQERAFAEPKIDFMWNTVVVEVLGDDVVTGARLRNLLSGEESEMAVAGVFIFIGQEPSMDYLKGLVAMDDTGHVIVNEWMETDVRGLFAAGDVRRNAARQVVSSAGDGATAAIRADQYMSEKFGAWTPPS